MKKLYAIDRRDLYLSGEINSDKTEQFIAALHKLYNELIKIPAGLRPPIVVWINSVGGSITDALAIYDALRAAPTMIITVGMGKVHSSALTIMLAANFENRYAYPNVEFMTHDASWKSEGPRLFLKDRVDQLNKTVKQLIRIYVRDTRRGKKWMRKKFFSDLRDHYFSVKKALKWGFIAEVLLPEEVAALEPRVLYLIQPASAVGD